MAFLQLLEDNTAELISGGKRPFIYSRIKLDTDQKNKSDVDVKTFGAGWKGGVFAVSNDVAVDQMNYVG